MAAKENLGTLSISDVLLRPSFTAAPEDTAARGFSIGESSVAMKWALDESFSGHVRLGSEELVAPPRRFVEIVDPNHIVMVEAYSQYDNPYGRFRLGKLPIEFGLEGAKSEGDLIFPRAFLFEQRIAGLRDIGASYAIEHNHFFTEVVIHNGEGGGDKDGNFWYTGRWGYNFERAQIGLAGQTGKTKPSSTQLSNDTFAGVDPMENAKWRMAGLFASIRPRRFVAELEGYAGERAQDDGVRRFMTGHFDVGYEWTEHFSSFVRYDVVDPEMDIDLNANHRAALAFVYTNKSRNSRLILMAAHDFNEGHDGDDQYRFIWSLSPTQLPSSF